ncbi:heme binding [Homalodisca vitripennis]|nr:heme binding [Homalodisca vitripennis]
MATLYSLVTSIIISSLKFKTPIILIDNFSLLGQSDLLTCHRRKYPDSDAVGYYQFLSPKLMIRNPALVKRVLISDFSSFRDNEIYTNTKVDPLMELNPFLCRGDTWKPARSTFVAGLTASKLKSYLPLMKDTLTHLDDFLASNLDKELEAKDFSNSFFMTLVSNTAYGVDANCFTDPNAAFRKMVELLSKTNWQKFHNVIIIFFLQSLKTWLGYSFAPKPMQDFGAKVMREVTETRVKTGTRRNDYIQCYLDRNNTVEEKVFELSNHAISFFIGGMETSSITASNAVTIRIDCIRLEHITSYISFFIGIMEISSITASNAVYELALHQDYQDRLYQTSSITASNAVHELALHQGFRIDCTRTIKIDCSRLEHITYYISFFIWGIGTSSITTSNDVYELALHQDYQDRLFQGRHPSPLVMTCTSWLCTRTIKIDCSRLEHITYYISLFIRSMETSSITASNAVHELALHQGFRIDCIRFCSDCYLQCKE